MPKKQCWIPIVVTVFSLMVLTCSDNRIAGNTSELDNPTIYGSLYAQNGSAASGAVVHTRPQNTLADTSATNTGNFVGDTMTVIADKFGRYAFDTLSAGTYVIEANDNNNNVVFINTIRITNPDSTMALPSDTLKPAGAIKGIIKLSEGGDPRKVFVLAFGLDRFALPDAQGRFSFIKLAKGNYDLRFLPSLQDYGVLDMAGIPVRVGDTTNLDTVVLPFTGIPAPKSLQVSYDTLNQTVILSWNKMDTLLVDGFNIYRAEGGQNFALLTQTPLPETTTVYRDSNVSVGTHYEYRVVARKISGKEGTMVDMPNDTITAVSSELVTTHISMSLRNTIADTASVDDTVRFCLAYSNQTRVVSRISWFIDNLDSMVKNQDDSARTGNDTLAHVWKTPGTHTVYAKVTDAAGTVWNVSMPVSIVLDIPIANAGSDLFAGRGDTIRLKGSKSTDRFGKIISYEWDIGNTGDFSFCQNGDTAVVLPDSLYSTLRCILRVTNNRGLSSIDTQIIGTRPVWIKATAAANFSARCRHASVVFNNKIWVIGGSDASSLKNDVWYSADGANWTLAIENAAFSPREDHTALVFNNKIWVIAGWSTSSDVQDVWNSSDGITWTLVTSSAGFGNRYTHSSLVFNNKLWVIGGNSGPMENRLNDVWNSEDGVIWNKVTDSAAFCPRSCPSSCVFNGKMWVIGGVGGYYNQFLCPLFDCWYSTDGISWNLSYSDTLGVCETPSVVLDNKIMLIGGYTGRGFSMRKDILWSKDGDTWNEVPEETPGFLPRATLNSAVTFNNRIFITGGYTDINITRSSEVWFCR